MKRNPFFYLLLPIFLCGSNVFLWAQEAGLGKIDFPTSGSEAAQPHFLQGVLLLHSFEYEDAAEAFQQAQQIDTGFVMAYWGEAMTHNHPIWHRQYQEKAVKALEKLAATPEARIAKARTPIEKDWMRAVEILFGEGEKEERDVAYSAFMEQLHEKYRKDHEIAAFYALSILGSSHGGRDEYKYMRAASVVEEVYSQNPEHPGALHYLIHSYDDPIHAPLGMRAARKYAKVAARAAHALHMPSHIFIAMGMWEEVVASNEASTAAADARRYRKKLGVDSRGYHSLHWLQYGYLQQGRYTKARQLLEDMKRDYAKSGSRRAAFHLAMMRAGYLIETEKWDSDVTDIHIDETKLSKKALAADRFVRAIAKMNALTENSPEGNPSVMDSLIAQLENMAPMHDHQMIMPQGNTALCCSPNYSTTDDEDPGTLHAIHVMTLQLKSLQALLAEDEAKALELLQQAADMEAKMDFMFGPPVIVKPSHELLGELLSAKEDYAAAAKAYELALQRAPGRTRSLGGLVMVYAQLGNRKESKRLAAQVEHNLIHGDSPLKPHWLLPSESEKR